MPPHKSSENPIKDMAGDNILDDDIDEDDEHTENSKIKPNDNIEEEDNVENDQSINNSQRMNTNKKEFIAPNGKKETWDINN